MDDRKRLNQVSAEYQKRLKDPNWKVGNPKDLSDFSKGAQQSGMKNLAEGASSIKEQVLRAYRGLKK